MKWTKDLNKPFTKKDMPNRREAWEKILGITGRYGNVSKFKSK